MPNSMLLAHIELRGAFTDSLLRRVSRTELSNSVVSRHIPCPLAQRGTVIIDAT